MKIYTEGKSARMILIVTSLCKRDPTVFWSGTTKKFKRLIFDNKDLSVISGRPVKTVEIRENPRVGNTRWTADLVLVDEHDLRHISTIIRSISDDVGPEDIAIVGRRCFLERFRSEKDRSGSRYHWSGNEHPFGWIMYIDKNGERLDDILLSEIAGEIGSVFMTNFENEMDDGRLSAAKKRS